MAHREHDRDRALVDHAAAGVRSTLPAMTHPRRYAVRMLVFLAIVGTVALALHEQVARFFMRNPPLNALILSVLGLGTFLSIRLVLSLETEVERVEGFRRNGTIGPISGPSPLDPLTAMLATSGPWAGLTATTLRIVLDGIDSRLDERRDTSRYLIALLIFLGLLGTFWGLLLTASSVGETIRGLNVEGSDPAQMFATLRTGLEAPLAGMGTAFSTSLFGLASSLVLGFLDLQASQAQGRFASELETCLVSSMRAEADPARDEHEHEGAAPAYLTALLQQSAENLDTLARRMVRAADDADRLHDALRQTADRVVGLCDELRARGDTRLSLLDGDAETRSLLQQIATTLDRQAGSLGETVRTHARTLDLGFARVTDDAARGRDRAVDEIRSEIRLLARTLATIAERER